MSKTMSERGMKEVFSDNIRVYMEEKKELLDSGFIFSHRRLEDYIDESGKALKLSGEMDWGDTIIDSDSSVNPV